MTPPAPTPVAAVPTLGYRGCSVVSDELGEPLPGTASVAATWLLIEEPGPWGHDALTSSAVPSAVAVEIATRCKRSGIRPLMIRRRDRSPTDRRMVAICHTGPERTWIAAETVDATYTGLLDLDLDAIAADAAPPAGWTARGGPMFLVCTHAKRDACCALFGRPVAQALIAEFGSMVWEVSHTGGHRFASVLIAMPHGLTFGRLDSASALTAAAAYMEQGVQLDGYRGRACHTGFEQAAEIAVREHLTGLPTPQTPLATEVTATETINLDDADGARRIVAVSTPERSFEVEVTRRAGVPPRLVGCDKTEPTAPMTFTVVAIR